MKCCCFRCSDKRGKTLAFMKASDLCSRVLLVWFCQIQKQTWMVIQGNLWWNCWYWRDCKHWKENILFSQTEYFPNIFQTDKIGIFPQQTLAFHNASVLMAKTVNTIKRWQLLQTWWQQKYLNFPVKKAMFERH